MDAAPPSSASPTVLHVDAERGFSGGEVQVLHLIRGLLAAGIEQLLVAPPGAALLARAEEAFEAELAGGQLQLVEIAMRNNADLLAVHALRKLFRRHRANGIVHLHTGRATWLGAWAARGLGLPVVATRRMDRRVKTGWGTRSQYAKRIDRIVAISGPVQAQLLDAGVPADKVEVIHSAVDPGSLRADPELGAAVRAELGLGEEAFVLLVLAHLTHRKGVDVLLRSMLRLRQESGLDSLRARNSRAAAASRKGVAVPMSAEMPASTAMPTLLIAGDGPVRASLEEQAKLSSLGDAVRFLGHREDKHALLSAADAVVLPSRQEGLGVAALEAMAAGRAVVASAVGGLGEAVVDGQTGLLVAPDVERELSVALRKLLKDRDLCRRLGRAGPLRVQADYSVDGMVAAYQALYARLRS